MALLVLKNTTGRKVLGSKGKDLQIVHRWYLREEGDFAALRCLYSCYGGWCLNRPFLGLV